MVMPKVLPVCLALLACAAGGTSAAVPARCAPGPAMLVHVAGFKAPSGIVRVQLYGGDPAHWFDKGTYIRRIEAPAPHRGALDVCMPVPAPGEYAVSVRHDVNGSGRADRGDGGGLSGNPHMSLFDLMFKRKPPRKVVAVEVAHGVATVPVTLNYLQGTSFRPITE